jgi:hypothetical protein
VASDRERESRGYAVCRDALAATVAEFRSSGGGGGVADPHASRSLPPAPQPRSEPPQEQIYQLVALQVSVPGHILISYQLAGSVRVRAPLT